MRSDPQFGPHQELGVVKQGRGYDPRHRNRGSSEHTVPSMDNNIPGEKNSGDHTVNKVKNKLLTLNTYTV